MVFQSDPIEMFTFFPKKIAHTERTPFKGKGKVEEEVVKII